MRLAASWAARLAFESRQRRELKVIAALTDSTLDKLLQSGADMVIEKFKRTRGQGSSLGL